MVYAYGLLFSIQWACAVLGLWKYIALSERLVPSRHIIAASLEVYDGVLYIVPFATGLN